MSKAKKTIRVGEVVAMVNRHLRVTPPEMHFERLAMSSLAEQVLFAADQYAGFQYIDPDGHCVGAERIANDDFDRTRRRYFMRDPD